MSQRRLPKVSPSAAQLIEPQAGDTIDVEPVHVATRPTLMERVTQAQAQSRERSRIGLKNSWITGLSGWGCMILTLFNWPWHIGTVIWVAAVLLWTLAFFQWMEFIVERRASRMYPEPEDLGRR